MHDNIDRHTTRTATMPEEVNQPHYALLAYARDMHQYTLELWLELTKKLDGEDASSVPHHREGTDDDHAEEASQGAAASRPENTSPEAESPQD